jgi:hypothetical protein
VKFFARAVPSQMAARSVRSNADRALGVADALLIAAYASLPALPDREECIVAHDLLRDLAHWPAVREGPGS